MAQYTITTLSILKSKALLERNKDYYKYNSISEFVEEHYDLIFEDYPIHDESHRKELSRKIVDHFLFHEISTTPTGKWLYMFNRKLREIMPYYNQMYAAVVDPDKLFNDTDYKEILDRTVDTDTLTETERESTVDFDRENVNRYKKDTDTKSTQKETSTGDTNTDAAASNTPISNNTGLNHPTTKEAGSSKSKASSDYTGTGLESEVKDETRSTLSTEETKGGSKSSLDSGTREIYEKHFVGKKNNITHAKAVMEYREAIVNIDMLIINDLKDMFRFIFN